MTDDCILLASLARAALQRPDAVAVQCAGVCLTYGGMAETLRAFREKLPALHGRRVLIMLPDSLASYLAHLTSFIDGAITIPVSPQTPSARLEAICGRVQPHLVITTVLLHARHEAAFAAIPCARVAAEPADHVFGSVDLVGPGPRPRTAGAPDELRMIVFTSGSTGEPKGVCLTRSNLLFAAQTNTMMLGLDERRTSVVTVPLFDYYGFIQIYSHLLGGSRCIMGESSAFPARILSAIEDGCATDLVSVPHTLRKLVELAESGAAAGALASLGTVTSSSDYLDPALVERLSALNPSLVVYNIYGLTEAGRASFQRIDAHSKGRQSIGRAAAGVEIALDDTSGEIIIRGPNVMRGYLQSADGDRVIVQPCTEMRTGDLGARSEDGEIVLLGRRDSLLNIKGTKVHPAEIERVALRVVNVRDARARSIVHGGETAIHLDLVADDEIESAKAVRRELLRGLPPALLPREITCVPQIARTELGAKLLRN